MLAQDPVASRLVPGEAEIQVARALDDGQAVAQDVARACATREPYRIAECAGIPVLRVDDPGRFGTLLVYADYRRRPASIRLYITALGLMDAGLGQAPWSGLVGSRTASTLFLAHELYHHFDLLRGGGALLSRHRVPLLRVGRWRATTALTSLAEVAAGSFVQALLGLPVHPKALDLIVLQRLAPQAARRFMAAVE
jgi:hypothetical protein